MSYQEAIEAAGYKVLDFERFGDYSGEWAAILEDGGVILDYYGGCSCCDAFESFRDDFHYSRKITQEELKKFFEEEKYEIQYDYKKLLSYEKWNSDSKERAIWLKTKLTERGFLKEEIETSNDTQDEEY